MPSDSYPDDNSSQMENETVNRLHIDISSTKSESSFKFGKFESEIKPSSKAISFSQEMKDIIQRDFSIISDKM
jgi:hypothetical protein